MYQPEAEYHSSCCYQLWIYSVASEWLPRVHFDHFENMNIPHSWRTLRRTFAACLSWIWNDSPLPDDDIKYVCRVSTKFLRIYAYTCSPFVILIELYMRTVLWIIFQKTILIYLFTLYNLYYFNTFSIYVDKEGILFWILPCAAVSSPMYPATGTDMD